MRHTDSKWRLWTAGIAAAVLLAWAGWLTEFAIQGNRFTAEDGARIRHEFTAGLATHVAVPAHSVQGQRFQDWTAHQTARYDDLIRRLERIERKLDERLGASE